MVCEFRQADDAFRAACAMQQAAADLATASESGGLKIKIRMDDGQAVRIGREADNDVVVATEHASRLHARIFSRDGNFVLADQSTNGTFLIDDAGQREVRLRRSEAVLGERGWIGLGKSAASHG